MQAIQVAAGPYSAADDNGICESQKPAAGGVQSLTLNGALVSAGVALLSNPRRVLITSSGNDSTNTFIITGTNWSGSVISETITGPASPATVYSVLDYLTVTSVKISGNAVGNIIVGTNIIGGSKWVRFDDFAPGQITVQCVATASTPYSIQTSLDDPNDPFNPVTPVNMTWLDALDANLVSETTSKSGYIAYAPKWARVYVSDTSTGGSVIATFLQSSNGPI